jgi:hypothetical protein
VIRKGHDPSVVTVEHPGSYMDPDGNVLAWRQGEQIQFKGGGRIDGSGFLADSSRRYFCYQSDSSGDGCTVISAFAVPYNSLTVSGRKGWALILASAKDRVYLLTREEDSFGDGYTGCDLYRRQGDQLILERSFDIRLPRWRSAFMLAPKFLVPWDVDPEDGRIFLIDSQITGYSRHGCYVYYLQTGHLEYLGQKTDCFFLDRGIFTSTLAYLKRNLGKPLLNVNR